MNSFSQRVWWAVRPLWYWRLVRMGLRSFWVACLAGLGGWLLARSLGWGLPAIVWGAVGYAVFMILLPTLVLWPVPIRRLAQRIDLAFGLRDRLRTAREVAERNPQNYVEANLLQSAHSLLGGVRRRLEQVIRMPWIDLALSVLAVTLVLAAYMFATTFDPPTLPPPNPAGGLPEPLGAENNVNLPGLPPEMGEGAAPFEAGEQPGDTGAPSPEAAQEAYDALAEALGENSVTEPAAAALSQGDALQAANELRELAGNADQLSEQTRQELAESLAEAAQQTQDTAPEAAEQMAEAARQLAQPAGNQAAEALESLAELAEQLDEARSAGQPDGEQGDGQGQGQGEGAGGDGSDAGREEQSTGTTDRLQSEGETVELPEPEDAGDEAGVLTPPEHTGNADEQRSTPYTHSGAAGTGGNQGADPLSFPWRWRNVIQRYFSPP